jgi:hypothetical protein
MFRFFTGSEPVKSDIVPQRPRRLTVSGRAVLFPQNVGVEDATLRIWRLDPRRAAGRAPTRWTRHRSPPTDPGLPTNFLNPQTSPISNQTNGMIVYVVDSDGVSDLSAPIPEFAALPFQSGVDLFIPAARPPTRRCRLRCGRGLRAGSDRELSQPPVDRQPAHRRVQRLRHPTHPAEARVRPAPVRAGPPGPSSEARGASATADGPLPDAVAQPGGLMGRASSGLAVATRPGHLTAGWPGRPLGTVAPGQPGRLRPARASSAGRERRRSRTSG